MPRKRSRTSVARKRKRPSRPAGPTSRVYGTIPRTPGLSKEELLYARQLVDPCGSELSRAPIGGSEGSFVYRTRGQSTFNLGAEGNQYNGYCFYHPTFGAFKGTSTTDTVTLYPDQLLCSLPEVATGGPLGMADGWSTRTVAACLQIRYLGSELNRAGKMAVGIVPGQLAWSCLRKESYGGGAPLPVSRLFTSLEHSGRNPPDGMEINWVPGTADLEFHEPQYYAATNQTDTGLYATYEELLSRTNFVCVAWTGVGSVNAPIELVATAIQERYLDVVSFTGGNLPVITAGKRAKGNSTVVDKVIGWLQSRDPRWYINAVARIGSVLGAPSPITNLIGRVGELSLGTSQRIQAIGYR